MSLIKVYHGASCKIENPSFDYGRVDTDFGLGFYVTADFIMAEKWASRKKLSIVNEYVLDTTKLKIYDFGLDEEWLDFIIDNRNLYEPSEQYKAYDILSGATADDKLFSTIEQYEDGLLSAELAVKILNCIEIGEQLCIKTQKALDSLKYIGCIELSIDRKQELTELNRKDRIKANKLSSEMIRGANRKNRGRGMSL